MSDTQESSIQEYNTAIKEINTTLDLLEKLLTETSTLTDEQMQNLSDILDEHYLKKGDVYCINKYYAKAIKCYSHSLNPKADKKIDDLYNNLTKDDVNAMKKLCSAVTEDQINSMGKSAIEDHCENMVFIGDMYLLEKGVTYDYTIAKQWYEKAANLNDPQAMFNIGILYSHGLEVAEDHKIAMEWYKKSANLNHHGAMCHIGNMYYDGEHGITQDYILAMEWYQKSANLHDSDAMYHIGDLYHYGLGVEEDYAQAMEWYRKSAHLHNPMAMEKVGHMYYEGYGVPQNYDKAHEWYAKAELVEY